MLQALRPALRLAPLGNAKMNERIVAAAICYDGIVYSVPPPGRHHTIAHHMGRNGLACEQQREQGFLTSLGRYVNREEACRIAQTAGQLEGRKKTGSSHALYSEDLW
jgi:hypothetical protein